MRRFLRDLLIFVALQAVLLGTFLVRYYRPNEDGYLAVTVEKHELLSNQPSPRIVFVGGSNLAFGLDSTLIADRLPYHPVNMGLYAGFGLPYMVREVEDDLRNGDVVVLVPEYDHFIEMHANLLVNGLDHILAIEARPANIKYLRWTEVKAILDRGAVEYVGGVVRSAWNSLRRVPTTPDEVYRRGNFNALGDAVGHWDMESPGAIEPPTLNAPSESGMEPIIQFLNQFHERCQQRKVTVLLAYPSIAATDEFRDDTNTNAIDEILRRRLTIPIIDSPEEMFLPPKDFFGTHYHLTREGARKKTELLIKHLQPWLLPRPGSIDGS